MPTFLYRCPITGYKVQGFVADSPGESNGRIYEPLTCAICNRIHLVNLKTAGLLAEEASATSRSRQQD